MKNLQTKTVSELIELARQWGLSGYSKLKKAELVKKLSGKFGKKPAKKAAKGSAKKKAAPKKPGKKPAKKTAPVRKKAKARTKAGATRKTTQPKKPPKVSAAKKSPSETTRNALPQAYRDGSMVLVARDPYWLYAYWDLTEEQERRLKQSSGAALRVLEDRSSGVREVARIPLTSDARSWYLPVDTANRSYRAELGVTDKQGKFVVIITSNPSITPSDTGSDVAEQQFASFVPGKPPKAVPSPVPKAQAAKLGERMYDISNGAGIDSAEAQAGWGQPSSHSMPEQGGKPGK